MIILYFFLAGLLPASASAQNPSSLPWISTGPVLPSYVSLIPNINDFTRFADGGHDANWYIGFNNAWIVRLPAAPQGDFTRAFIGAKIGRAKTRPNPERPWLREEYRQRDPVIATRAFVRETATETPNKQSRH